jgi:hypothetical protein
VAREFYEVGMDLNFVSYCGMWTGWQFVSAVSQPAVNDNELEGFGMSINNIFSSSPYGKSYKDCVNSAANTGLINFSRLSLRRNFQQGRDGPRRQPAFRPIPIRERLIPTPSN